MRKIPIIIFAVLIAATAFILVRRGLETEEARIKRQLSGLADVLSKSGSEEPVAGIARARRAASYFTPGCRVEIQDPNLYLSGRTELASAIHMARHSPYIIRVGLHEIEIFIEEENRAEILMTASATIAQERLSRGEIFARAVEISMVKENGQWQIDRAVARNILR